jgi:short chain dehydrogenase
MKRLEGKIAIVTGAGRGIGRGIAVAYAREGANVVVASRTKSTVDSTVSEIEAEGGTALGVACDVGRRDDIFAAVSKTIDAFGAVNILVNNAQGFGTEQRPTPTPRLTPLEDFDEEAWEYTFPHGRPGDTLGHESGLSMDEGPWRQDHQLRLLVGANRWRGYRCVQCDEGSDSCPQPYGRARVGGVQRRRCSDRFPFTAGVTP